MSNQKENLRVKYAITEALFTLLKKKSFSEITVSDIVKEAGVARSSYYRNFENTESIIEEYLILLHEEILNTNTTQDISLFSMDSLTTRFTHSCSCFLSKKSYILTLYKNGFGSQMQEIINQYVIELAGTMSVHSIHRYVLYFISGATFNILIQWLKNGADESPYEIASFCSNIFLNGIKDFISES